jgi:ABC-type spermidine/putrescine transport system permease subunit I
MAAAAHPVSTNIPQRMDRLPWSRWHWLTVTALGITWILDGLEVTIVSALGPVLTHRTTLGLSESQVGLTASAYLTGAVCGAFVFVYVWLPFMILPVQAALERVPGNLVEASSDLGASPGQTFRNVLFPLALPGIVAGSIFTFSLTLGDYIIPQIIGTSRLFIGQAVYSQQGTAGNIPLAAAFTVVPVIIMGFYLWGAKRMGAFDAL